MPTPSPSMPALLGGDPVRPQGPPQWPLPDPEVLQSLQAVFHDGSWGQYHGLNVENFEERLTRYHGETRVTTCGSGTYAVELALRALKVRQGEEVVLAGYDYPGNFLAVHEIGAVPVLAEIDPDNWNLSVEAVEAAIGPKTRAVIASHLHGGLIPMRELRQIAARQEIKVIEDAAQAIGAIVQGRKAGTWGDVSILSFGGSKLLSAGRGGALLTPHADVHQRLRVLLHRGNNVCPLSELQAAVLLPQLEKLDVRNAHRARSAARLADLIRDVLGLKPFVNRPEVGQPSYYKVGMRFDASRFGLARDRFVLALRAEGIAFDEGFPALHIGRSSRRFRPASELKVVNEAHHGSVVLHHPILLGGDAEVEEIALAIRKTYANAQKLA